MLPRGQNRSIVGRAIEEKGIDVVKDRLAWDEMYVLAFPVCMGLGVTGGVADSVFRDDKDTATCVLGGIAGGFALWTAPIWLPPVAVGTAIGKLARTVSPLASTPSAKRRSLH